MSLLLVLCSGIPLCYMQNCLVSNSHEKPHHFTLTADTFYEMVQVI